MQGTLFAGLGGTVYLVRRWTTPPIDPRVIAAHPSLGDKHAALGATLSQLVSLEQPNASSLLDSIRKIIVLDTEGGPSAQWQISRLTSQACREAEDLCKRALRSTSTNFAMAVSVSDEAVTQLKTHLEDLLHNHLLDHALT